MVKAIVEAPEGYADSMGNVGSLIYTNDYVIRGRSHGANYGIVSKEKAEKLAKSGKEPALRKGLSNHYKNFLNACQGIEPANSSFDIAGPLAEMLCLGCIALNKWENPYDYGKAEVVKGEVHLTSQKGKWFLLTKKEYANFVFEGDIKMPVKEGNSGFLFRCQKGKNRAWGYQAEVDTADRKWSGGLYDKAAGCGLFRPIETKRFRLLRVLRPLKRSGNALVNASSRVSGTDTKGSYTLTFRYASSSNRPCDLFVNNQKVGRVAFASTGSFTKWVTVQTKVTLKQGGNAVKVVSVAAGPNLDALAVTKG